MSLVAFDTHAFVKRLTAAGMPESQAEVLAEEQTRLIESNLATKRDIADIKRDIAELKHDIAELKHDMKELEATLKRDMKELEATLKRDIQESEKMLRMETEASANRVKAELVKWMFAALVGQTAVLAALIRLL